MALYEYECEHCGGFEVRQKMSDPPLERHSCGGRASKRISATSFALKGGGWYADGYKAGGACAPGGCDKPSCAAKLTEA